MSYCTLGRISDYSELYRPRYGQFTKAGQITPLVKNLVNFRSHLVLAVLVPELVHAIGLSSGHFWAL